MTTLLNFTYKKQYKCLHIKFIQFHVIWKVTCLTFLYAYELNCSICVIVYNIYFVKDMKGIFIFIVCIWESTELVKNFVICLKIFSWLLCSLFHGCFQNCSYKFSFHICEQFKWMGKKNIYSCLISCEEKVLLLCFL